MQSWNLMVDVLSAELDQLNRKPRCKFGWDIYHRLVQEALLNAMAEAGM